MFKSLVSVLVGLSVVLAADRASATVTIESPGTE